MTKRLSRALLAVVLAISPVADAETPEENTLAESVPPSSNALADRDEAPSLVSDIKAYFTAPVRWDRGDWAWFGISLAAIGAAHHYDTQVRTHFVTSEGAASGKSSTDLQDAVPTAAVLAGTWLYASFIDDNAGRHEAWVMLEAGGLSAATAYALKFTTRRQRPDETDNSNEWFKSGGDSFPSQHSTVAFAVGTVLAESGNDEFRWVRRVLGYGLGVATSYERLKHNAHWLSDTVAGAALGIASARFAMHRSEHLKNENGFGVTPVPGGAMLSYRLTLE